MHIMCTRLTQGSIGRQPKVSDHLMRPTTITKTIAPRIAEIQPPIPAVPNNHPNRKPPINEPTMPTMMFPINPNPWPAQIFPAIQPIMAPIISQPKKPIIPSISIHSLD